MGVCIKNTSISSSECFLKILFPRVYHMVVAIAYDKIRLQPPQVGPAWAAKPERDPPGGTKLRFQLEL